MKMRIPHKAILSEGSVWNMPGTIKMDSAIARIF